MKNTLIDKAVIPGAGAFEAGLFVHLNEVTKKSVEGRAKRGVEAFAEAMLVIPKTLAENSGYDDKTRSSRSRMNTKTEISLVLT